MKATHTHSNNRAYLVLVVEDDGQVIGDLAGLMIETAALRPAYLVELELWAWRLADVASKPARFLPGPFSTE